MKIYRIKPMLVEKVRLCISGSKRTRNDKKGVLCKVTWYSNGDYEIQKLSEARIHVGSHIPFNPMTHESFAQYGWGDDHEHYDDNNISLEEEL